MKRKNIGAFAFVTLIALTITAGCHGQQPPSPTTYTCPATTGSAYTVLNPPASNDLSPASITGTSTTDTPGVGAWCYIVQSWAVPAGGTIYQVSVPSNSGQATTTSALPVVHLSWTAPSVTATYTSYTYILSRAAATPVTAMPTAPPLVTPTVGAT
jgi:hypothetical protein